MSTEFFNDQWRIPSNENQNKVSNYSMDFDGSSDFIDCGSASYLNGLSQFSISCWFNLTTAAGLKVIVSDWNYNSGVLGHFALETRAAANGYYGLLLFLKRDAADNGQNNVFTDSILLEDTWHNAVFTFNSGTVTCYLNGSSVSLTTTGTIPTTLTSLDGNLNIGKFGGSLTRYWPGQIDQVSIFDYELSSSQVSTLYGGGTAITHPMTLSPKPIYYAQLGDQSVDNGANYLVPNNSLSDYVFNFIPNDRINVGNDSSLNITGALTLSIWMKSTSTAVQGLISKNGNEAIYALYAGVSSGNDVIYSWVSNDGSTLGFTNIQLSGRQITDGNWHNIIMVNDPTTTNNYLYVDGVEVVTSTNGRSIFSSTVDTLIGAWSTSLFHFNGELSNAQIFNSVIPPTGSNSVQTIYNNGSPLTSMSGFTSLVSWWKLNAQDTFDGTNWTIKDYAGSNDGTSVGMTSANLVVSDLQQTSGYSPYALSLDGTGQVFNLDSEILLSDNKSVSFWFKLRVVPTGQFAILLSNSNSRFYPLLENVSGNFQVYIQGTANQATTITNRAIESNVWYNFIITGDGTTPLLYINGTQYTFGSQADVTGVSIGDIGARPNGTFDLDGDMSNVAIWSGTTLSSTEVTEVYNQGVTSNLNTFSGTKPTAWWQLGSNSSFNTNWTCLDEIGTNNAVSVNMTNNDIVDGPGYSASGVGTSSIGIKGDAPYSTANGLSENMDVLDRTTDVPS